MNQLLQNVHIPSFILGFIFCMFLSLIRPGLLSIFGGLISFFKVVTIFGMCTAAVFVILKSQQQQQIWRDRRSVSMDSRPDVANTVSGIRDGVRQEAHNETGEYNYFPIPITKFENDPKEIPSRSALQSREMKVKVSSDDIENKYDKTLRYENFVKMAQKSRKR
ncbi:uncharacterized protein PWA37_001886 [Arxiozyma heterogenica]|uniref:uncharacterized protein n=1 Tax=Arxiozyma heterogenica TaxID=278026 RepID=UPI002EDD3F76